LLVRRRVMRFLLFHFLVVGNVSWIRHAALYPVL
jgi:hypothetical protein